MREKRAKTLREMREGGGRRPESSVDSAVASEASGVNLPCGCDCEGEYRTGHTNRYT